MITRHSVMHGLDYFIRVGGDHGEREQLRTRVAITPYLERKKRWVYSSCCRAVTLILLLPHNNHPDAVRKQLVQLIIY
jgi:hypothetical protein